MAALKMRSLQLMLMELLLLFINNRAASDFCQNIKTQNCSKLECRSNAFMFGCPPLQIGHWESKLSLKVIIKEEAKLECTSPDVNYEWLQGIYAGEVDSLDIQSCPLPQMPFHLFLDYLNISGVTRIQIQDSFANISLNNEYFQGMKHITHLLLPMNGLNELPPRIFQNMTNLNNLDLHENALTLVNDELATLVNLKKLELGSNNIQILLPGTFKNLKQLEFLNLWGNKLKKLSKNMFDGLENLSSLDVSNNQISFLSDDVFTGMKNLKILNLLKNNFTSLPENIFLRTPKLKIVKLHNNDKLSGIPPRLFANLSFLQEIHLSRCNLTIIPEDIFWGSHEIVKVDLSGNSIATLHELLFRDTVNLKDLDVSNNKISYIPDHGFKNLKLLKVMRLNNNKITTINEESFLGLSQLQSLHAQDNSITHVHLNAFQDLMNMSHLFMSRNNLTLESKNAYDTSPFSKCTNLTVVDLSHNYIRRIFSDWMWILTKLQRLDLSNNNFTELTANDLQFLSEKIEVNLQNNKISSIDLKWLEAINAQNIVPESTTQISVIMSGNQLECDCKIYDVLRYQERLMNTSIYEKYSLKIDTLTCKGPPHLTGYPIVKLNSQKFTCPWNFGKTCPNQCQCLKWLAKKHIVVNCTGAGLLEIPKELLDPQFGEKLPLDLILDKNSLHSLPMKTSLLQTKVSTLSVSHNHISWIDDNILPNNLQELKLDNNNMTHLNSSLLKLVMNKTKVSLYNNPWHCDCDSLDFLGFLQVHFNQVERLDNVTCNDGRTIARLTSENICPYTRTITIIASTTIAVVGIVIGLLAALYFRYTNEVKVWLYAHNLCLWFVTEEELDKDKVYDAFISYSHQDEDFVTTKLLPELENGTLPYKICVHYRDWIVGEFITTQIARSVEDSKRTIVVLSKNFIQSEWGRLEFRAAHKQALTEKRARVIVVIYGDLGPLDDLDSELRTYLSTNTYVKWGDPWFWDKLRYALPHHRSPPLKTTRGMDKLELINSTTAMKASTPPADLAVNPLELINNLSSKRTKILNEMNGYTNNGYSNNSVKSV